MSDDQIHGARASCVRRIGAHACFELSVAADGDPGQISNLAKRSIAIVLKQKIRHVIVGDEDVLPTVVIVVECDHAESIPGF